MEKSGLYTTGGDAIPLISVRVAGTVLGGFAEIQVRQRYENDGRRPVEAIYTFPLPSDATLVGFSMTCAGRRLEGKVQEREQAFREYDDAMIDGHGAAMLEQERPNVFTASIGNLLPGEETVIEIAYVQRLRADEGALRVMIPTVVAPRYIPGARAGDRTADGWADPTDRVPDADRISPRIGAADYGLSLDLVFDVGRAVAVESPSHRVRSTRDGNRVRVELAAGEVALDRDLILVARDAEDQTLAGLVTHREGSEPGFFALTVVPDLGGETRGAARQEVVFLIDVSGSMDGASLPQAKAALRMCLRHLREGDRFNVIAFQSIYTSFERRPVPFTQATLDRADAFVDGLFARGGTQMLEPLRDAVTQATDGVIVLLTDGQVGNEAEIHEQVMEARGRARVYSFGIGTAVSDALLTGLARATGGGVEYIFPGERIDDKVVATFARAVAPRVEDVKLEWDGVQIEELAPSTPGTLVDGEPWIVLGRFEQARSGAVIVRGTLRGERYALRIPLDFSEGPERPTLPKLWAAERIRDLERRGVEPSRAQQASGPAPRREQRMRERIVELATRYGVSSPYTAFLVVETRTGDRRATEAPETRNIPVDAPVGWEMLRDREARRRGHSQTRAGSRTAPVPAALGVARPASAPRPQRTLFADVGKAVAGAANAVAGAFRGGGGDDAEESVMLEAPHQAPAGPVAPTDSGPGAPHQDPIAARFQRQLASGLWDDPNATGDDEVRRLRATGRTLLWLHAQGITAAHAKYGAQVKKAIAEVCAVAAAAVSRLGRGADPTVAAAVKQAVELALGAAALVASGHRTKREVERAVAAAGLDDLGALLADPAALRARLAQIVAAS